MVALGMVTTGVGRGNSSNRTQGFRRHNAKTRFSLDVRTMPSYCTPPLCLWHIKHVYNFSGFRANKKKVPFLQGRGDMPFKGAAQPARF